MSGERFSPAGRSVNAGVFGSCALVVGIVSSVDRYPTWARALGYALVAVIAVAAIRALLPAITVGSDRVRLRGLFLSKTVARDEITAVRVVDGYSGKTPCSTIVLVTRGGPTVDTPYRSRRPQPEKPDQTAEDAQRLRAALGIAR
jgi:hypothetical protein